MYSGKKYTYSLDEGNETGTQASKTVGRSSKLLGVFPNMYHKEAMAQITFDKQVSKRKDSVTI